MDLKVGHYWIKRNGKIMPARWDGAVWRYELDVFPDAEIIPHNWIEMARKFLGLKPRPIPYECPIGCTCITLPNGSIKVDCTQ